MAKNTKVTAAKPAAKKPAAKPAAKIKNQDNFFNKFSMPVIKLGLVGALTAGIIGLTNEFTKDAIATNIYNQKVAAYKETGTALEGWEFNGKEKLEANYGLYGVEDEGFGIFNLADVSEKMPSTTFVQEMMVYCETSTGADCNADSSDTAGFGFMAIGNHGGYGEMQMLITTDKDGIIKATEQLAFITSFSAQSANVLKAMDGLVGEELNGSSYVSGATTSVTNSGVVSMMNEMKVVYDSVAADPAAVALGYVAAAKGTGSIDATSLNARLAETTTKFAGVDATNNQITAAAFADGSYMFVINWMNESHGNIILFDVASDGKFSYDLVGADGDFGTGGSYGNSQAKGWLDVASISSTFDSIVARDPISGGTDTYAAIVELTANITAIWANKGGTA